MPKKENTKDAAQPVVLTVEGDDCVQKTWNIQNWHECSQMVVAAEASFHVEVGNPKVVLRFFLRSKEEFVGNILWKWYSLCAEVLTQLNENAVIKVTTNATAASDSTHQTAKSGVISLNKSKEKVVEVIDRFIFYGNYEYYSDSRGGMNTTVSDCGIERNLSPVGDMNISVTAQMFRFTDTEQHDVTNIEKSLSSEAEDSLTNDLKNMFVAHENYADLKLESKDHMTLDAHKFILAARSRYLQKTIDDAMKTENFNGTIKMNINGKPLVAILHWMYTGELHETAGSVMEEVVDAAILFELTHLMKLLDTKIITICNKDNMFPLYQVAQKNGMPNAMDDISAYIREHL